MRTNELFERHHEKVKEPTWRTKKLAKMKKSCLLRYAISIQSEISFFFKTNIYWRIQPKGRAFIALFCNVSSFEFILICKTWLLDTYMWPYSRGISAISMFASVSQLLISDEMCYKLRSYYKLKSFSSSRSISHWNCWLCLLFTLAELYENYSYIWITHCLIDYIHEEMFVAIASYAKLKRFEYKNIITLNFSITER